MRTMRTLGCLLQSASKHTRWNEKKMRSNRILQKATLRHLCTIFSRFPHFIPCELGRLSISSHTPDSSTKKRLCSFTKKTLVLLSFNTLTIQLFFWSLPLRPISFRVDNISLFDIHTRIIIVIRRWELEQTFDRVLKMITYRASMTYIFYTL